MGLFANATPEGVYDLTGNAYTWTTSVYDQEQYPYPYQADDGRENTDVNRKYVLNDGSWLLTRVNARAAYRYYFNPHDRSYNIGFRVCRPPS